MIKAAKLCALPKGNGNMGFVYCKPPLIGRKRADRASISATMTALSLSLETGGSTMLRTLTLGDESEKKTHKTISRYLKIEESSHPC